MAPEVVLKINDVSKKYAKADRYSLNGIDLTITAGQFFGILGPNGSGKTTLISILSGLIKASHGQAFIYNYNINSQMKAILPLIGLVPQEIALYPTLTLQQNLQYFGSLYGLWGKLLKQRIEECLQISQLSRFRDKQIKTYSGGMKRRANLVLGLIHDPKIIFLDEPTANVDPQSRNVIFENLKTLIAQGKTIIYTTHYLEEAEQLCTDLAIIDDGKIITTGKPKQLIEQTKGCRDLGEVFLELTGKSLRDQ